MATPRNSQRANAAGLGLAVGVVTTWAFSASTGIVVPVEVASAWGAIVTTVCAWLVSRFGV